MIDGVFMKKQWMRLLAFVVLYLGVSTSGIWLPTMFIDFDLYDISLGFITVVLATTICASVEKVLSLCLSEDKKFNVEISINIFAIIICSFSCYFIIACVVNKHPIRAIFISSFVFLLSCALWWYQNRDNDAFNAYDTIE